MFPTPCKISTITATGSVNTVIHLDTFYNNVEVTDDIGIVYIEYGHEKNETICRGFNKMTKVSAKKKKKTKRFDNQVTCVVTLNGTNYANVKVFKNGKIQMTGIKTEEQGSGIIDCIIEKLQAVHNAGFPMVVGDVKELINLEFRICLINSDFRVGWEIRRDRLNKIMQNSYGILSSFEPCIYPGVKIQFFMNLCKDKQDGVCECDCACNGKGRGKGSGLCKKITIAVFQSGCIIITGAQTLPQIGVAYAYICDIVKNHKGELEKILPIMIKKESVLADKVKSELDICENMNKLIIV